MSKEQALAKMLEEMAKEHSSAEDAIHNWLCDQTHDDALMAGICKDGKSIKDAMAYCMQEAKKQAVNNAAMVDDKTVFAWVRTYFVSDNVKLEKVAGEVKVSKKTKPKENTRPKETVKTAEPKKDAREQEQMNLFDFSD